ncbi:putative IST1 like protein [Fusarium oxysporum f. sp. albedinis]|nr:putative IST1 like protein [Fusarium oxysporum f. sp. albedinis]
MSKCGQPSITIERGKDRIIARCPASHSYKLQNLVIVEGRLQGTKRKELNPLPDFMNRRGWSTITQRVESLCQYTKLGCSA